MSSMKLMPTPKHVDIAITGKCNLACQYCFFADEMVALNDLPTERWLSFFDELGRLGVMTVCLTGGEVFTRPDLFELIDGIIANRMRYSLLSNGTLITADVLNKFATGKRRQRLDSIQISIDGSRADIHDLSRPDSFEHTIQGLRALKEAGFPVSVRVTVNRFNINDLENVAHLLLKEVGITDFSTNEAYACSATEYTANSIILTPKQRQKAMDVLTQLAKRYNNRIIASAGPLILAREMTMIETMLASGQTSLPGRGALSACGGVFTKIAVLHDGTIVPCHLLNPLKLGTIGIDKLQDIWLHHSTLNALRSRMDIPLDSLASCQGCRYLGFCKGGCPGGALQANGDFNTRSPMSCFRILKNEDPFITLSEDVNGLIYRE